MGSQRFTEFSGFAAMNLVNPGNPSNPEHQANPANRANPFLRHQDPVEQSFNLAGALRQLTVAC